MNDTPNTESCELTNAELDTVAGGDLKQVVAAFTPSILTTCHELQCNANPMSCQH